MEAQICVKIFLSGAGEMRLFSSAELKAKSDLLFHRWKIIIESEIPCSRVEHVGSTSIVGALTKGDIDLYVEVPAGSHKDAVATLESLGFRKKQDTHRDEALCMLESMETSDLALQVVARGSVYEFFLKFRDALNADPDLLGRYNLLKESCSGVPAEEYRRRKAIYIEGVLASLAQSQAGDV